MITKELLDGLPLVNLVRAVASELHTHPQKLVDVTKVLIDSDAKLTKKLSTTVTIVLVASRSLT